MSDCTNCGEHKPPISDTPERILADLIAELRDEHTTTGLDGDCPCCEQPRLGCTTSDMADRAEARLREVAE